MAERDLPVSAPDIHAPADVRAYQGAHDAADGCIDSLRTVVREVQHLSEKQHKPLSQFHLMGLEVCLWIKIFPSACHMSTRPKTTINITACYILQAVR